MFYLCTEHSYIHLIFLLFCFYFGVVAFFTYFAGLIVAECATFSGAYCGIAGLTGCQLKIEKECVCAHILLHRMFFKPVARLCLL